MNDLVMLDTNNKPFTTTLIIAKGVHIEHRAVLQLLKTYINDIKELGTSALQMRKSLTKSKGRPTFYYELSELQATFLITLMKNSKIVVSFKKSLSVEFFKMREHISRLATQQTNEQWIEQRNDGKITRRFETDVIKDFIDYAISQGGSVKGCKMYYANISTMENKALFIVEQKYPNLRDALGITELSTIQQADFIVSRALKSGMDENMNYKDIYKMAKERVELYADMRGKTPLSGILNKHSLN